MTACEMQRPGPLHRGPGEAHGPGPGTVGAAPCQKTGLAGVILSANLGKGVLSWKVHTGPECDPWGPQGREARRAKRGGGATEGEEGRQPPGGRVGREATAAQSLWKAPGLWALGGRAPVTPRAQGDTPAVQEAIKSALTYRSGRGHLDAEGSLRAPHLVKQLA